MWASWALLLLRLWLGALFIAHGARKVGPLGGDFDEWLETTRKQGLQPARLFAVLGAVGELAGGVCLLLGFATPVVAGWLGVMMVLAITKIHGRNGFFNQQRGLEFPASLLVALATLGIGGPGALGLDNLLFADDSPLPAVLFAAVLLGGMLAATLGERRAKQLPTPTDERP